MRPGRRRARRVAFGAAAALTFAGCGVGSSSGPVATSSTSTAAAGASATVWLCRPGASPDPCAGDLDWTSVSATGARTAHQAVVPADPPVDCFYLYPTVSTETTANSDLQVQPAETAVAIEQAARFSTVCRVWAPMYRQRTVSEVQRAITGDPGPSQVAYRSALSAWHDYLAHDNGGRPVVLIGHSQGAIILTRIVASEIDPVATLRRKLVSAVLLGANVTTASFPDIPPCRATSQTGCVVAYSSFLQPPPADSLFGVAGQGAGVAAGEPGAGQGEPVLCVNPAAPGGGEAALDTYVAKLSGSAVRWFEYPGRYEGSCSTSGAANWLQVTPSARDTRPTFKQTLGARWGLHLDDVNVGLGNLVAMVAAQSAAFNTSG